MSVAPTLAHLLAGIGVLGSLVWIGLFVEAGRHRKQIRRLADLPETEPPGGWPRLAVIVAARDEAEHVERAVRSMLALDYPRLQVIAVDDRSTDATGAILDRLAGADPRLTVRHIEQLPDGWLGKTHALQTAAGATDASWLLFTDADVIYAPGALRRVLSDAVHTGADHVVVPPEVPTEQLGERVFLLMFQLCMALAAPFWRVERRDSKATLGIGAFNLVRAEAFRAIGGFQRIALSVDDDLQLGRALKFAGYQTRVLLGGSNVSVRWQVGLGNLIRGLEKNFFAVTHFDLPYALFGCLVMLVIGWGPFVGLCVGPTWSRALCGAGVFCLVLLAGLSGAQSRIGFRHGLTLPLGALACAYALIRSIVLTLRRGGVSWRNHLYPLASLRRHVRDREAWLRQLWASTR